MYVDILVLAHLTGAPAHGYEIKKRVQQTLGSDVAINNNILYPALRRFEEMGAVEHVLERVVERQSGRPDRHVYRLTDRGEEVLQGLLREFPPALARDDDEFHTRVAFFDLLDAPGRRDILRAREAALRERLAHYDHVISTYFADIQESPDAPTRAEHANFPYGLRVVRFLGGQLRQELEWIATLAHDVEPEPTSVSGSDS